MEKININKIKIKFEKSYIHWLHLEIYLLLET